MSGNICHADPAPHWRASSPFCSPPPYSWAPNGAHVSFITSCWLTLGFSLWDHRAEQEMPGALEFAHSLQTSSDNWVFAHSGPTCKRESAELPHERFPLLLYPRRIQQQYLGFLPQPAASAALGPLTNALQSPRVKMPPIPISWSMCFSGIYKELQYWKWNYSSKDIFIQYAFIEYIPWIGHLAHIKYFMDLH